MNDDVNQVSLKVRIVAPPERKVTKNGKVMATVRVVRWTRLFLHLGSAFLMLLFTWPRASARRWHCCARAASAP